MKLSHIAAAALLASIGGVGAQAQPAGETPGISQDAARPTMQPRPGTNTPAGVIQGVVPPMTGQGHAGAEQGTVPVAPPPGVPPQGEVRAPAQQPQTGLAPGNRGGDAQGMGAGRPATSMPPGSIAGQAPGMGASQAPTAQGLGTGTGPGAGTVTGASPGTGGGVTPPTR